MSQKQAALVQRTTRKRRPHLVQPLLQATGETTPVAAAVLWAQGINAERTPGEDGKTGERPRMVVVVVGLAAGGGVVRIRHRSWGRGVDEWGQRRAKHR